MPREALGGWCPGSSCHMAQAALEGEPDGSHLSLWIADLSEVSCLVLLLLDDWPRGVSVSLTILP